MTEKRIAWTSPRAYQLASRGAAVTVKSLVPGRGSYTIAVGDEVKLWAGRRDVYHDGRVAMIGRTLVHIDGNREGAGAYRMDDQGRSDGRSGYFLTLAQYADMSVRAAAVASLRAHGIDAASSTLLTGDLTVLAEFVQGLQITDPG